MGKVEQLRKRAELSTNIRVSARSQENAVSHEWINDLNGATGNHLILIVFTSSGVSTMGVVRMSGDLWHRERTTLRTHHTDWFLGELKEFPRAMTT
jgi:hypothetical protein